MLRDKFTNIFSGISFLIVAALLSVSVFAYTIPDQVANEIEQETRQVMAKDVECLANNI